ncbi:EutP/PduV family microcompartment system protein [Georgenia daeguensis]|uniref:EutP/PduV family microcompartment system protein n=1 Tax=Georgenia daeguensis TaxID=908355 RepID=A0ABP6UM99_9MICO
MRSILLIGSVGVGKTTLRQRLHGHKLRYAKTQALETEHGVVDTPGEFLESRIYKSALINASYAVDLVVLVQAADVRGTRFPPGFASAFNREVIGVVTKCGLAKGRRDDAVWHLRLAGASKVFCVDSLTGDGLEELIAELHRDDGTAQDLAATKPRAGR